MSLNTLSLSLSNTLVNYENIKVTSIKSATKRSKSWNEFETKIKWGNTVFILGVHSLCLYTLITFPYRQKIFLFMWSIISAHMAMFGITAGVHRLWAHRAYKAKMPLRIILATLYYSAGMNSISNWVRDHRVHHKYSDTEADPHDITRGFFFSHVGWLMMKKRPIVIQRGKGIDMSDIKEDPVVQFFDKNFAILNTLLAFVIPVLIPVYLFNQDIKWTILTQIFIRYPYILNIAWAINSVGHRFGYRSYDKSIQPAENIFLGIISGGESWHNYHHVFPWDYRAAEINNLLLNYTAVLIDLFARIGWAYDLKQATPQHIEKVVEIKGDETHSLHKKLKKAI